MKKLYGSHKRRARQRRAAHKARKPAAAKRASPVTERGERPVVSLLPASALAAVLGGALAR